MKERFKIIPAVYLILIKNNKIFLSRRFKTGYMDGFYSLVAGHLEGNEYMASALIREAQEEINICIKKEHLKLVHVMHKIYKEEPERIDFFFMANQWEGEIKNNESEKCDDIGWFKFDNLPENILPHVKRAIHLVEKDIFYSESTE